MRDLEVVKLIRTELTRRGKGVEGDPVRIIIQYWDFEGHLIFEVDKYKGTTVLVNEYEYFKR